MMIHAITWWKESNSSNGFWEICSDPLPKADGCVRSLFFSFFFFLVSEYFQNLYQSLIPVFCPFLVLYIKESYIYSKIIHMELEALGCGRHFRTNFIIYINKSCLITKLCLFVTPWTVTHQAPLSMGFSRQGHWSGLPFPTLGDLVDPGIKPCVLHLKVDSLPLSHQRSPIFLVCCPKYQLATFPRVCQCCDIVIYLILCLNFVSINV